MKKLAVLLFLLLPFVAPAQANDNPHVWLDTDFGPIIVELYPDKAPITVENFLAYVNEGFYDGLIFHRVVSHFVIQAGGYDSNGKYRTPDPVFVNKDVRFFMLRQPSYLMTWQQPFPG